MKVLITDLHGNGIPLAQYLTTQVETIEKVFHLSESIDPALWQNEKWHIITERLSNDAIIALIKNEGIDWVSNFDPFYGVAGLLEALQAENISCIGSNKTLSETEINKHQFKQWLVENKFKTPEIRFEGLFKQIAENIDQFVYPLVIKPDSEIGPKVQVCHDQQVLKNYLDVTAASVPYAKFGVLFIIEEYLEITEHMHVLYVINDKKGVLTGSVKLSQNEEDKLSRDECGYAVIPHPEYSNHRAELQRFVDGLASSASSGIGSIQCTITADNQLYFIENNARPGSQVFFLFDNPLILTQSLLANNSIELSQLIENQSAKVTGGIALLHKENEIAVDYERLSALSGIQYCPNSVTKKDGRHVSKKYSAPSMLLLQGNTLGELEEVLERHLPVIQACGDFYTIDPRGITQLAM
jgi:phosphoribosylamine-glycine ligase